MDEDNFKIPSAGEAFLKTQTFISPAQKKRDEAYAKDVQDCLVICGEHIRNAILEGKFNTHLDYHSHVDRGRLEKDLTKRLAELGYKVDCYSMFGRIGIKIHWGVSFWDKLFKRRPAQLALPLLPPEEFR